MATFPAYSYGELGIFPRDPANYNPGQQAPIEFNNPRHGILAVTLTETRDVTHTVIDFLEREYAGWDYYAYFHDYYNRVWLVPTNIDFGPVTALTSKQVFIWNAHLNEVTLDDIVMPDDPSIYLTGLQYPFTMPALGGTYFNVWAEANGQPSINTSFQFQFTPTEAVNLPIQGIRARLWPFPMDWGEGYTVNLAYRTEIQTSDSGKEKRIAVRQNPRKDVEFKSVVQKGDYREFLRQMNYWQGRSTIVPDFARFGKLSLPATEGQAFIVVEHVEPWMQVGGLLVMIFEEQRMIRTISDIDQNTIAFSGDIAGEWLPGTKVFKGLSGHLATEISGTQHTNRALTVTVNFSVDPGYEEFPVPPPAAITWRGREVWMKKPNWGQEVSETFQSYRQTLDYGKGRLDFFLPVEFNDRIHRATYVGRDMDEGQDIEDFYARLMGQQVEFYMPTYTEDIEIYLDTAATTSNLRIKGPEFARDYLTDTIYKDLIIFLEGGLSIMKSVQQIYEIDDTIGNDSIIQTTEPFPTGLKVIDVRQICWMPLWRMGSDTLTLSYLSDEVCQFQITMKTTEYEDDE